MKTSKNVALLSALTLVVGLAGTARAQLVPLANIGSAPSPGPNDIYYLGPTEYGPSPGNPANSDGLNNYADAGVTGGAYAGATFTTGNNGGGYTLNSLTISTASGQQDSGNYNLAQPYQLNIYSISGVTATLVQSFRSGAFSFTEGSFGANTAWLRWTNLAVPLLAGQKYAYTFGRMPYGAGFFGLGWHSANPFSGGEICLIPTAGGTVIYGPTHNFDGVFDLGISLGKSPQAPVFSIPPTPVKLFSGKTAKFSAFVAGDAPISYRWLKNGAPLSDVGNVSGSQTNALTVANVGATDTASYSLVASNATGVSTSSVVALTVASTATSGYSQAVIAKNPVTYLRLGENAVAATYPPVFDWLGGASGTYGSAALTGLNNIQGPRAPTFAGFETTNFAMRSSRSQPLSGVSLPAFNLHTNTVTITAWVNPSTNQFDYTGLLYWRSGADAAGLGFTTNSHLGYTWNTNAAGTWGYMSGLKVPTNMWSLVALTVSPTRAILYLYNANGFAAATNNLPHRNEGFHTSCALANDPASSGRIFNGDMDEVAVFKSTLTATELQALYNAALTAPAPSVTLGISSSGNTVTLTWPQGTLLEADNLNGFWSVNNASSPYTFPASGPQKYYRVQVQ